MPPCPPSLRTSSRLSGRLLRETGQVEAKQLLLLLPLSSSRGGGDWSTFATARGWGDWSTLATPYYIGSGSCPRPPPAWWAKTSPLPTPTLPKLVHYLRASPPVVGKMENGEWELVARCKKRLITTHHSKVRASRIGMGLFKICV